MNFGHDALESKAKSTTPPSRPVTLLPMRRLVDFDATPLSTTQQPTYMSIFRQVRAERGSHRRNMAIDGSGGPFEHKIFNVWFFPCVSHVVMLHAFAAKTGVFEAGKEEDCRLPCRVRPATALDVELVQRDHAGDFMLDSSKIVENDGLGGSSPWPFPLFSHSPELVLRARKAHVHRYLFAEEFETRTLTSSFQLSGYEF